MFTNFERSPPRDTPSYPPGGDEAAEPEAAPTIPSGPAQCADHELVLTIYGLFAASPSNSWSGTTAEFLEGANRNGRLIGVTPEQIDHDIENLENLFEFRQIQHFLLEGESREAVRHVFLLWE